MVKGAFEINVGLFSIFLYAFRRTYESVSRDPTGRSFAEMFSLNTLSNRFFARYTCTRKVHSECYHVSRFSEIACFALSVKARALDEVSAEPSLCEWVPHGTPSRVRFIARVM